MPYQPNEYPFNLYYDRKIVCEIALIGNSMLLLQIMTKEEPKEQCRLAQRWYCCPEVGPMLAQLTFLSGRAYMTLRRPAGLTHCIFMWGRVDRC